MPEKEWRFGRMVRERFVGVMASKWPMGPRTEWNVHLLLGPLDVRARLMVPNGHTPPSATEGVQYQGGEHGR